MKRRAPKRDPKLVALATALGQYHSPVLFTFDCMEVAEVELRRPNITEKQARIGFRLLVPTAPLIGKTMELYRCHVREILDRVKRGGDTRLATDAELLALFLDTSLKAPLHRNAQAATEILWSRCFPKGEIDIPIDSETWPGGAREEIEKARRKARREERR